jgi:hypothetical protein
MRSQVQGRQQPWLCLALKIPQVGHVVGDLLRVAPRCEVERWPTPSSPGCRRSVCLERSGGRSAGCGWLGQGFHQRPDLGVGVASVPAQGTKVGQPAFLGPATHGLWGHMKELGDLRCSEVPRLAWLWHHALRSCDCPPDGGRPYAQRIRMPSSVLHSEPAAR